MTVTLPDHAVPLGMLYNGGRFYRLTDDGTPDRAYPAKRTWGEHQSAYPTNEPKPFNVEISNTSRTMTMYLSIWTLVYPFEGDGSSPVRLLERVVADGDAPGLPAKR